VPVLDLEGGVTVHAVRGQWESYGPGRSRLAATADPVKLARALQAEYRCDACYVADLDAIASRGDHGPPFRAIAALGLTAWLSLWPIATQPWATSGGRGCF
jgi:phosphoribosylformimino-5-aminoimidazole carboxamide ribotide isomerase